MAERQEQVRVERDNGYERRRKVVAYNPPLRGVLLSRGIKLIWFVTSIIDVMMALRFVLKLIAANPGNVFADFVYSLTNVLVSIFEGMVNNPTLRSGSVLDVGALFAIVIYTLLALAIVQLLRILFSGTGASRHVTTIEQRRD